MPDESTIGDSNAEDEKMISETEGKRRTEAAIASRFKKQAEESAAAEEVKRQRDAAILELNAIKTQGAGAGAINLPEQSQNGSLNTEDVNNLVANALATEQRQREFNTMQTSISNVLAKGYEQDPELKTMAMDKNGLGIPGEALHAILGNLGEKGLPAIKNALKNADDNAALMERIYDPAKMVAWASKFNSKPTTKENDFPTIPDISEASGSPAEDDTASLVRNSRV